MERHDATVEIERRKATIEIERRRATVESTHFLSTATTPDSTHLSQSIFHFTLQSIFHNLEYFSQPNPVRAHEILKNPQKLLSVVAFLRKCTKALTFENRTCWGAYAEPKAKVCCCCCSCCFITCCVSHHPSVSHHQYRLRICLHQYQ